jgi:AcrR family transcriptional regulator
VPKASTKERIIEAAVRLFNESSASEVSTNHIAEAAGVSPGNLYYHFRNKEEIIRAILDIMMLRWDEVYALPTDRLPTLADLQSMLEGNFAVLWDYRFFYREMAVLMRRDPQLSETYLGVRRQGLVNVEMLFAAFVQAGVLNPPDDATVLPDLAIIIWLIADFWLPFVELEGKLDAPEYTHQGVRLILQTLRPYVVRAAPDGAKTGNTP